MTYFSTFYEVINIDSFLFFEESGIAEKVLETILPSLMNIKKRSGYVCVSPQILSAFQKSYSGLVILLTTSRINADSIIGKILRYLVPRVISKNACP
jgi:hypothetical protein